MTDNAWERFAKQAPYWAVLTDPRYKTEGGTLSAELQEQFFRGGEEHIQRVTVNLERHFGRRFSQTDSCLDFGCGVGRLLLPMAKRCGRAIGIDVSETMRHLCMRHALDLRIPNVSCYASADHPAIVNTSFDWVNSYIVFQHIDTRSGMNMLDQMLTRVNPGGVVSLHFTVFKDITLANFITDKLKYFRVDKDGIKFVENSHPYYEPNTMMMNDYDINRIYMSLTEHGFTRILSEHENQNGMHSLLFYSIKNK